MNSEINKGLVKNESYTISEKSFKMRICLSLTMSVFALLAIVLIVFIIGQIGIEIKTGTTEQKKDGSNIDTVVYTGYWNLAKALTVHHPIYEYVCNRCQQMRDIDKINENCTSCNSDIGFNIRTHAMTDVIFAIVQAVIFIAIAILVAIRVLNVTVSVLSIVFFVLCIVWHVVIVCCIDLLLGHEFYKGAIEIIRILLPILMTLFSIRKKSL